MQLVCLGISVFINLILGCYSMCIEEYGPNPTCRFVPAPPGKTPPCARPGLTYCEYPDNYPSELIYHLIEKWQFNHKSLIINEAKEEFHAFYAPPPTTVYGPPALIPSRGDGYHYPKPIYTSKPAAYPEQGGFYLPSKPYHPQFPQQNLTWNFNGYPDYNKDGTFFTYKYTSQLPQGNVAYHNPSYHTQTIFAPPTYTHINDIWKRSERLKRSLRNKRTLQITSDYVGTPSFNNTQSLVSHIRNKRQSTLTRQTLCRSRSSFIMPRAALNSKGNWMYVVNMPANNQQFTQLVKSETCLDSNCNGLCQLPQGYTSRCEQKYVQKRLIALEGNGSDLYSDTFWFPSCCVCTISNN